MMNNKDLYTPIECGLHSEYELAIMHKSKLQLRWLDAMGVEHSETIEPVDLCSRNKEEFLKILTTDNKVLEIRLDKIIQFSPA